MAPPQAPSGAVPQKDSKGGAFMTFMVMRFVELTLKDEKPQQRTQFQTIPESSHALLTEPRGKIFADH